MGARKFLRKGGIDEKVEEGDELRSGPPSPFT